MDRWGGWGLLTRRTLAFKTFIDGKLNAHQNDAAATFYDVTNRKVYKKWKKNEWAHYRTAATYYLQHLVTFNNLAHGRAFGYMTYLPHLYCDPTIGSDPVV